MSDSPLKEVLDAVFGPPPSDSTRIVLSDKRLKQLKDGQTLQFKAGKQIIRIEKEK